MRHIRIKQDFDIQLLQELLDLFSDTFLLFPSDNPVVIESYRNIHRTLETHAREAYWIFSSCINSLAPWSDKWFHDFSPKGHWYSLIFSPCIRFHIDIFPSFPAKLNTPDQFLCRGLEARAVVLRTYPEDAMKRPTHPLQVLGDVGETRPVEALLGILVVAQQSIDLIHLRFRIVTAELNEALEIIGLE